MNKLKVAINDLKDHLGRDTRGLAFLDKLKTVANEQRTRCATLEEDKRDLDNFTKQLCSEYDVMKTANESLRAELSRVQAKLTSSELREQTLMARLAEKQADENVDIEMPKTSDACYRNLKKLIAMCQSHWKTMPDDPLNPREMLMQDFVKNFSQAEFAGLGIVVAVCAMMGVPMLVRSEWCYVDLPLWKPEDTREFAFWFRKRMKHECELQRNIAEIAMEAEGCEVFMTEEAAEPVGELP